MKIITRGLATVMAGSLILALASCAQAVETKTNPAPELTALATPITFEDGILTDITITQPLAGGVQNNFTAATLGVAIDTANIGANHATASISSSGDSGQTAWGAFSQGSKDLAFDYGASLNDGRVALNFGKVASGSLADMTKFGFSVEFPQFKTSGGIGINIILTGSDGIEYSLGDTWCWTTGNKVWNTYTVPLTLFKAADATTLASVKASVTVKKISFVFRLDYAGTNSIQALDTKYTGYMDSILFE